MERKIIGVTGIIGSGKDSFSKPFIEAGFQKISFADTLKDAVSAIFGWDREMLSGDTVESREFREQIDEYWSSKLNRDVTPRWVLQNIGTDVLRKHFDNNIWIYSAEKKISQYDKVIVTDCRFVNEIKLIRNLGGTIVEVHRHNPEWYMKYKVYNQMIDADPTLNIPNPYDQYKIHSSETAWIGRNEPDHDVYNTGTLESLRSYARHIISIL